MAEHQYKKCEAKTCTDCGGFGEYNGGPCDFCGGSGRSRCGGCRAEGMDCWYDSLSFCSVCGGLEGALLPECPGYRLSEEEHDENYKAYCAGTGPFRKERLLQEVTAARVFAERYVSEDDPECTRCGSGRLNAQHLAACPDDCGAHDYDPAPTGARRFYDAVNELWQYLKAGGTVAVLILTLIACRDAQLPTGPSDKPAAPPPPVRYVPPAAEVRGDFLALGFTAAYCGGDRARIASEAFTRGYTHLVVTWALTYRGYPSFVLTPAEWSACLRQVESSGLRPVGVMVQMEVMGRNPTRASVEPTWRSLVNSSGCPEHVLVAWEWNDFTRTQDHYALAELLRDTCPNSQRAIHFSPGLTQPSDAPADYWSRMVAAGVTRLYYQASHAARLQGFEGVIADVVRRMPVPVVAFEYNDPHNQTGVTEERGLVMGCEALRAGAVGFLNGGPTFERACP